MVSDEALKKCSNCNILSIDTSEALRNKIMNKDIINPRNQNKFSGLLSLAQKEKIKVNYSHLYSVKYRILLLYFILKDSFLNFLT